MKKHLTSLALFIFLATGLYSQESKFSFYNSGEWILSGSTLSVNDISDASTIRFSPWYNSQHTLNYQAIDYVGIFLGLDVRNVGFIYQTKLKTEAGEINIKKKFRTYNLGIPLGIKIGKPDGLNFYAGYEIEFPFHYKEKTYTNGIKNFKHKEWFSDRVPTYLTSVYGGIESKKGFNLKFKLYLDKFFNPEYKGEVNGMPGYGYDSFDVQVFYVSICMNMFHDMRSQVEDIIEDKFQGKQTYLSHR